MIELSFYIVITDEKVSSSLEISYGNREGKLEVYPMGEYPFGSEAKIEGSSSVGSSYSEVSKKL